MTDAPMAKPRSRPRPTAAPKPRSVVTSVWRAWSAMGPAICTSVTATAVGRGSTICWMPSSATTASHATSSATNAAVGNPSARRGAHRISAFSGSLRAWHGSGGGGLALAVGEPPREGKRHRVDVSDASGVRRHHVDRVSQDDRLAQVVGDEHARELAGLPQRLVKLPYLLA